MGTKSETDSAWKTVAIGAGGELVGLDNGTMIVN